MLRRRFMNSSSNSNSRTILYTTTDGNIINEFFKYGEVPEGLEIVKNTYSGQQGILEFNKELTEIPNSLFYESYTLQSVQIPDTVTSIGQYAFCYCENLEKINTPNNLVSIGYSAFEGCVNLVEFKFPKSLRCLYSKSFSGSGLREVTLDLDNNLEFIPHDYFGDFYFSGCNNLVKVTLRGHFTGLKYYFISECNYLKKVDFSKATIDLIPSCSIYECPSLSEILLPEEGNTCINRSAIYNTGIESITITKAFSSIEAGALYCNTRLKNISVVPENTKFDSRNSCNAIIETETNTLLCGCDNTIIPQGITALGSNCFSYVNFPSGTIQIPDSVRFIYSSVFTHSNIREITIPEGITELGFSAFSNCANLSSVNLPDSLTYIGNNCFGMCPALNYIEIPKNLTSVGSNIFSHDYIKTVVFFTRNALSLGIYNFTAIHAPYGSREGDYVFSYLDNQARLVYYFGSETSLILPDDYLGNNYSITSNAFSKNKTTITSIKLGEKITEIESNAFKDYTNLINVTFNDSISTIGDRAFSGCSNLTGKIDIPTVTTIGGYAFENTGITGISFGPNISTLSYTQLYNCQNLTEIIIDPYNTKYEDKGNNIIFEKSTKSIIKGCKNSLIPEDTVTISLYAFSGCTGISKLNIPNSVVTIELYAFSGCSYIPEITVGTGLTNIRDDAFSNCSTDLLKNYSSLIFTKGSDSYGKIARNAKVVINMTENTEILGDFIFDNIDGVNVLTQYIGEDTRVVLPEDYKNGQYTLGDNVFKDKTKIVEIEISSGVNKIGAGVFSNTGISSITIPNTVTEFIDTSTLFSNSHNLTSVYLPDSLTYIGNSMFSSCEKLETVVFSENSDITGIDNRAFYGCSSLKDFIVPSTVTSVGEYAFYYAGGIKELVITPEMQLSLSCFYGSDLEKLKIEEGVTTLPNNGFTACDKLTSVIIPDSVTNVGVSCFYNCSNLSKLIIGTGEKTYGSNSFKYCSKLEFILNRSSRTLDDVLDYSYDRVSVNVPNSIKIGDFIFNTESDGVTTLCGYVGDQDSDSIIILPDTYEDNNYVIGKHAFFSCPNIVEITIGSGVSSLSDKAFKNCSNLLNVYCKPIEVPTCGEQVFTENAEERKIYVPEESLDLYLATEGWNTYADSIIGHNFEETVEPQE